MKATHSVIEVAWKYDTTNSDGVKIAQASMKEKVVKSRLSKGEATRLADKLNRKQDLNDGEIISFLVRQS